MSLYSLQNNILVYTHSFTDLSITKIESLFTSILFTLQIHASLFHLTLYHTTMSAIAFASWFIRNHIDLSSDTIDSILSRLDSSWTSFSTNTAQSSEPQDYDILYAFQRISLEDDTVPTPTPTKKTPKPRVQKDTPLAGQFLKRSETDVTSLGIEGFSAQAVETTKRCASVS